MQRAPVLTLSAAVQAMAALDELHRVCQAMDLERQGDRPTEDEYQAAMAAAAKSLKSWAPHKKRNVADERRPPLGRPFDWPG